MTAVRDFMPLRKPLPLAISDGMSDTLPVPIRETMDPAQTPAAFLPILAVHRGVRLWFDDWAEARKRQVIAEATELNALIGTREAARRFLGYVDAELVDVIAYPARFVMGRAVIGRTPIGHPPFLARYLVKGETAAPPRAFVMGRAVIGRARLKTPSREPFRRCLAAIRAAMAPEVQIRVDFQHKRLITVDDHITVDDGYHVGDFVDRSKL